jgi:adenylylsulfate kinase
MIQIEKKRTIAKTVTWRLVAACLTFLVVYFLSGTVTAALSLAFLVSLIDTVVKGCIYYIHERLWDKTNFGLKLKETSGCTLWMTGLPCSGKTTIAKALKKRLEKDLYLVEHLDGDIVRKSICSDLGFSKEDRDQNIWRVTLLASYLSQRAITLCTFVSPYEVAREETRSKTNNYILVFVDCPVEECIKRDVKGMYKKALAGEIKGFTGVDDPYERPENPSVVCYTEKENIEESVDKILFYLKNNYYV